VINYIEFVGPQGVGKTTLLHKLMKLRQPAENWRTYQEAVSEIVDSLTWKDLKSIKSKILWLLNNGNFIEYKREGISNNLFSQIENDISLCIPKKYESLIGAHFKRLCLNDLDLSPINRAQLVGWYIRALERVLVLEKLNYTKTVVLDEGPIKNHYGLKYMNSSEPAENVYPNAVIFCSLDVETNMMRILEREKQTGSLSMVHNELNNQPFEVMVKQTHKVFSENVDFLRKANVPVFEADMTDKMVVDKVHKFVTHNTR